VSQTSGSRHTWLFAVSFQGGCLPWASKSAHGRHNTHDATSVCREQVDRTHNRLKTTRRRPLLFDVSRLTRLTAHTKHIASDARCRERVYQAHGKENDARWHPHLSRLSAWTVSFAASLMPSSRQSVRYTENVTPVPWARSMAHDKRVA
jgi:hypothetical protein